MINPGQSRAARALLDMSQKQVSEESCVSLRTIQGFESGERVLQSLAMSAIVRVYEDRGIVFISENNWRGVKLKIFC